MENRNFPSPPRPSTTRRSLPSLANFPHRHQLQLVGLLYEGKPQKPPAGLAVEGNYSNYCLQNSAPTRTPLGRHTCHELQAQIMAADDVGIGHAVEQLLLLLHVAIVEKYRFIALILGIWEVGHG